MEYHPPFLEFPVFLLLFMIQFNRDKQMLVRWGLCDHVRWNPIAWSSSCYCACLLDLLWRANRIIFCANTQTIMYFF